MVVCPFVPFLLTIVLSVLFDLRILITLPLCYLQTLLHEPIKAFLVYDPQTVRTDNNISAVVTEDTIATD
jgi:hypothetical protein